MCPRQSKASKVRHLRSLSATHRRPLNKACIAKETRRSEFPDLEKVRASYTHSLSNLLKPAGLEALLQAEVAANPDFGLNRAVAKDWSEKDRYAEHREKKARDLYRAVDGRRNGVMQWVRRHW